MDGHGVLALAALGGFGVGSGFGVGLGVDVTGFGVGTGVAAGVLAGVGAAVGAAVGPAVGAGVTIGDTVGTTGAPEARMAVGAALGDRDGLASIDGDGLTADGLAVGGSEADPAGVDVGVPGTSVDPGVVGLVGGITATGPCARADAAACCWSSAPPMPSAMVASTRFRTPRPKTRRTR